jgi:hypothetical protein
MMSSAYMKVLNVSPTTGTDHPVATMGAELVRIQRMIRAAGSVMFSRAIRANPSQSELPDTFARTASSLPMANGLAGAKARMAT